MVFLIGVEVTGNVALKPPAQAFVGNQGFYESVASENATRVGINDKDRFLTGIQQDIVGRFRADAVDRQEFRAQGIERLLGHAFHAAVIAAHYVLTKAAQTLRLDTEIARRREREMKRLKGAVEDGLGRQQVLAFQIDDGLLDIGPRGILRQHGAHGNLKRAVPRPPVCGTVVGLHEVVDVLESGLNSAGFVHGAIIQDRTDRTDPTDLSESEFGPTTVYYRKMNRFLLIGLDGAEPSLVERWMAEGRLPNLSAMNARGSYRRLASTVPPATFPAWTTAVTGVNPGRHGVLDFTEMASGRYAVRFVNSTFRKAPAVWNVLSDAGRRVGVLGVPATYPPEAVNGFMVSGFDSPVCTGVDKSFVYPAELYPEVSAWRFADFQESDIGPGWHDMAFARLMSKIDDKEAIATRLLEREPWDFFMVVFGESDSVAHHFWLFHDPKSPRHLPGREDAIQRVYERLDVAVGRLVDAAGPDVTVAVMSDHGMGGAGTGVVHLNNWLAEQGYLAFAGAGGSLLKQMALKAVPAGWRGGLFRRFESLAAHAESGSRFGGIDWSRTRAWSEELNYFPSIRVNLQGREPCGQIARREYDAFCRELCERIEAWPAVAKAWRRDEVVDGPYVDRAPDIMIELALENGYSYSCLRSRGGPSLRRIGPDEYLGGKERGMNGNHRPDGILLTNKRISIDRAAIQDVAPTVLAELGVPGPLMDGRALWGEQAQTVSPGLPPASGGIEEGNLVASPAEQVYTPEQERAVQERLRALGYLE